MPATCGRREFSGGLALRVASIPKSDRGPQENEDAAAWCLASRRFAVTDGATDAAFSGAWAAGLARTFVEGGPSLDDGDLPAGLTEWLAPIQRTWRAQIPWGRLPWYLEEKAQRGAFSTFLALQLGMTLETTGRSASPRGPGAGVPWKAAAVGDSCLFHWRDDALLAVFPLGESADFGTRPYLVGSNPEWNRQLETHWRETHGLCHPGDHFLLATDALAHWLLRESEQGRLRLAELVALEDDDTCHAWIAERRLSEGLRNDDTTLLHLRVGDDVLAGGVPGCLAGAAPTPSAGEPVVP